VNEREVSDGPSPLPRAGNFRGRAVGCAFCGAAEHTMAFCGVEDWFFGSATGGSDFARCSACRSLWQTRPLTPATLPLAYERYYTHDDAPDPLGGGPRGWLRRRYAAARLAARPTLVDRAGGALYRALAPNREQTDAVLRFAPRAPARVLDYGCGSGAYLSHMRGFGHAVVGVDFDPVAVAAVRSAGIECHTPSEAERLGWSDAFDAVTLAHVIEHVHEPAALLAQLARMLRPGGTLFVETPNAEAAGLDLFGAYWRGLEAPRHLAIPSPDALDRMLAATGFAVTRRVVRAGVRAWMWADSLATMPVGERPRAQAALAAAPPETLANAEFITLCARKGEA
jgi:2-polyprenyl-3-methyl-5-hydroxy-6-metoxy-1,4-benzoquinol methylase